MKNCSFDRTLQETVTFHDCIKRMYLSLKNHYFSGEELIPVLEFLARFVSEASILGISERQASMALP